MAEDISVTNFRNYLKIKTAQPDPNYGEAIDFLTKLAKDVGLECTVVQLTVDRSVVVMTLKGKDEDMPSIMLNSHVDVVTVDMTYWTHDPFGGHKAENGDIYGRGAQDMKCVGIQYVEAIRRLKRKNLQFLRTIHITFVPDEEIGGLTGMNLFVKTDEFKRMNVGFGLDEGVASLNDICTVFYAERVAWTLTVKCVGNPGHGSAFVENTAAEKMHKVVDKFLGFREEQKRLMEINPSRGRGGVTTVNLTMVNGGIGVNVVPAEINLGFDIRQPPTLDFEKQRKEFESWVTDAGATFDWPHISLHKGVTKVDDTNPWWTAFSGALKEMNLKCKPIICPGGTDARYLRELGYPALGFSPMANTPILIHGHDERLNESVFLKGIDIYEHLITVLANSVFDGSKL